MIGATKGLALAFSAVIAPSSSVPFSEILQGKANAYSVVQSQETPTRAVPVLRVSNGVVLDNDIQAAWTAAETNIKPSRTENFYNYERPLIVIDLGHGGGADKGAVSATGRMEKHIIDPVGAQLGDSLRADGFDVAYVRNPDEPYRYQRRAENIGALKLNSNRMRAEYALRLVQVTGHPDVVLISLHGDAGPSWLRGATTFAAMAENNNGLSDFGGKPLNTISVTFGGYLAQHYRIADNIPTRQQTADFDIIAYFEKRKEQLGVIGIANLLELGRITNIHDEAIMRDSPQDLGIKIAYGVIAALKPVDLEKFALDQLNADLTTG